MRIEAIWERPHAHPRDGGTFFLCDDRLFYVSHETEYIGTNADGDRQYNEIGLKIQNAFKEDDRFDFEKADYFLRHFGGQVIAKFN